MKRTAVDAIFADPSEIDVENWPREVAFVPYVGSLYASGIDGCRVLLLGESPYRKEGMTHAPEVTRSHTRSIFSSMATSERSSTDGAYFAPLDRLLTGKESPSGFDKAEMWKRISFVNLAQQFAGTASSHRPQAQHLREGGTILAENILPILRPHIILVLGRVTWAHFQAGELAHNVPAFEAERVNRGGGKRRYTARRDVWMLRYLDSMALMTWVYHPSWNIDHWQDRAGALRHLIAQRKLLDSRETE